LSVALRGFWPPSARGDGLRRAGARVASRLAAGDRGRGPRAPCTPPPGRDRRPEPGQPRWRGHARRPPPPRAPAPPPPSPSPARAPARSRLRLGAVRASHGGRLSRRGHKRRREPDIIAAFSARMVTSRMLRETWALRGFILASVRRDFVSRYLGTQLGFFWAIA